jgi:pyruvate formate lyase activating enzyme
VPLKVGGVAAFSTCDWPGELVATVFCQGCAWDCGYCHNAHLRPPGEGTIAWPEVMALLRRRVGLLDAVVFSGGEPTLQAALPAAMRAVRALGLRVGLHTAGPYPDRLSRALEAVDWIGFDAKAPFAQYAAVTGVPGSGAPARESLRRVIASGVAYEVRTTVHPALLDETDLLALADELAAMGVRDYAVQAFRASGCRPGFVQTHGGGPARLPHGLAQRFARFSCRGMEGGGVKSVSDRSAGDARGLGA